MGVGGPRKLSKMREGGWGSAMSGWAAGWDAGERGAVRAAVFQQTVVCVPTTCQALNRMLGKNSKDNHGLCHL